MTQIASTANYRRREVPGQLMLDFEDTLPGTVPLPSSPVLSPAPKASRPVTPDRISPDAFTSSPSFNLPEATMRTAAFCETETEKAAAKLDEAPGYKLSGKRLPENFPAFPNELSRLAASLPATSSNFVTDSRAMELIEQAAREVRPGEVRGVKVRFLPFRATLYSFKMDKTRTAAIKFHVAFRRASEAVILQAARLMLCRARKLRQTLPRSDYDSFVRTLPPGEFKLPGARRARKMSFGPQGVFRQLEESFRRVNETYFASQLKQPELCWSPVRARRVLGSYQERCDRLIVSRVFDSPAVPLFVLDFLMYHELLHKFLGVGRRGDGKRCMHGPEFKELERKFARFEEAQEFLKRL